MFGFKRKTEEVVSVTDAIGGRITASVNETATIVEEISVNQRVE